METVRLRRIQEPPRVQSLLEAFISRARIVPPDSYQVHGARSLPKPLRDVVVRATRQGQVWSCRARGTRIWLFTCDMSLPLSRERGAPVMLVRIYGEDAELMDSGNWRYDPLGTWSRCAD